MQIEIDADSLISLWRYLEKQPITVDDRERMREASKVNTLRCLAHVSRRTGEEAWAPCRQSQQEAGTGAAVSSRVDLFW